MTNRLVNMVCWLTIVVVFIAAGCKQKHKEDVLAYEPDVERIVVADTYALQAIEATGGYQAWIKARKLQLGCVVTFYKPDGSFYLTEQHHEICPWSNSIRVSALEPQGKFVWQLSAGLFSVLEADTQVGALPTVVCSRDFAEAILDMTTAPVRFLESKVEFAKGSNPVRMKGLWYYPIERVSSDVEPYWSKVVFYQNRDSSLVDVIWFADDGKERYLAVRGYNYSEIEKNTVLVPTKIEIFKTDVKGILQEQLVRIDYYSLRSEE